MTILETQFEETDNPNHAAIKNRYGAIASGHPVTSELAHLVLENGGNAYDAVIAATLMACASEPVLASLGGGGFFLGKAHNNDVNLLDFFVQSPLKTAHKELDVEKITIDFTNASQDFYMGTGSTATPGVVKGLFAIHKAHGAMPIKELFQYPCHFIRQGVAVTAAQNRVFALVKDIYLASDGARKLYASKDDKKAIRRSGEIITNHLLADTIEALSYEGEALFYRGEIASNIALQMKQRNGSLAYQDLADYECVWRKPLSFSVGQYSNTSTIYTNAAPALGGLYLKSLLKNYQAQLPSISRYNHAEAGHFCILAKHMRAIYADNANSEDFLLNADDTLEINEIFNARKGAYRGTTHISVLDKKNNIAAITLSNGEGNGHIVDNTGIMLNNMLGEHDVNPLAPNQWVGNQRLSSMMAPTLVTNNSSKTITAMGTGGSNRIPSALAQVIIQRVFQEQNLSASVHYPRVHFDKDIAIEKASENTIEQLHIHSNMPKSSRKSKNTINAFDAIDFYFGGVNAVQSTDNEKFDAVSDTRRSQ